MNAQLIARLNNAEDTLTERKPEGVNDRELRKELVAFANSLRPTQEAAIFVGISDTGDILGVSNPDTLQKRIRRIAEQDCYPPIFIQQYVLSVSGKEILAVTIPHSANKPHFSGPAFVRVGAECTNATQEQYDFLINSRSDKCYQILLNREALFTVRVINKVLGEAGYDNRPRAATHECRIIECNQHYVRLSDTANDKRYSEPLENVTVLHDEERHRPMLVIRP